MFRFQVALFLVAALAATFGMGCTEPGTLTGGTAIGIPGQPGADNTLPAGDSGLPPTTPPQAGSDGGTTPPPPPGSDGGSTPPSPPPPAGSDGGSTSPPPPPPPPGADSGPPPGTAAIPQPVCAWNEAYEEYGNADSVSNILANAKNCYVLIDPFDSTAARNGIGQMKANGNIVGCYISSGSCEDWRDDYAVTKPFCGPAYPGWSGEYFVTDTQGILPLMKARIDKMAGWGCNFVEFDNMDWALSSGNIAGVSPSDAIAYNQALCAYTRSKGMKCMAKSTTEGAADFDGLTVESYTDDKNWWSTSEMKDMLAKGGIGLVVHYADSNCNGVYSSYKSTYGAKLSFICSNSSGYLHFN